MRLVVIVIGSFLGLAPAAAQAVDVRSWLSDLQTQARALQEAIRRANEEEGRDRLRHVDKIGLQANLIRSLDRQAGFWPMAAVDGLVASSCRQAATTLLRAAEAADAGRAREFRRAADVYDLYERSCAEAIEGRRR